MIGCSWSNQSGEPFGGLAASADVDHIVEHTDADVFFCEANVVDADDETVAVSSMLTGTLWRGQQ
ncbi:MAG: hypothetical protein OTI34_15495 [Lewinella sp.]|nr:hypothetical protein [Lewinella sp.]